MYWDTVPAPVTAIVPLLVIGLFDTVKAEGIERPTLDTLLLKVDQSAEDKAPLLVAEAVGILIVIFPELVTGEPVTFMLVPVVPNVMPTEVTPTSRLSCIQSWIVDIVTLFVVIAPLATIGRTSLFAMLIRSTS
jgi:hypothetical protein